ncbi:MAG: DUF2480 family protein [Chitinophagaceae bacterium]
MEIINKVAESGLITLDLEEFYPKEEVKSFDLKEFLFMGLILKEKDYRLALQNLDWTDFNKKNVHIICTADAIIPMWAYMLAASYLQPVANEIVFGNENRLIESLILMNLSKINIDDYVDKRVVVKGCGELSIPEIVYVEITKKLRPVAKSIMFGEPCSTVPIFKKPINK